MKLTPHWAVILGIGLGVHVVADPTPDTPNVFRHQTKIVDANGQPLPGAVVELYRESDGPADRVTKPRVLERTTANESGTMTFTVTNSTRHILVASKPGLSLGWVTWYPGPEAEDSGSQIVLTAPAAVSGVVQDGEGKPIADAEVWARAASRAAHRRGGFPGWTPDFSLPGLPSLAARTKSDGRFRIERLPADAALRLAVSKSDLVLQEDSASRALFALTHKAGESNLVLTLKPAGAVEGLVVEEETGKPLPNAHVWLASTAQGGRLRWDDVVTETDGVFRLGGLSEGSCFLQAAIGTNRFPEYFCEIVTASVVAGTTNRDAKIIASRGSVIEVAVRDAGGRPLGEAQVMFWGTNRYADAPTSDQGMARIRLAPGQYSLMVRKDGWHDFRSQIACPKGQTNRQDVTLEPAPQIAGTVLDPEGKPAPKVRVVLFPHSHGEKLTDALGRFSLTAYPRGFGVIMARHAGRHLAAAIDVDEATTNVTIRLTPAVTLVGRVTDTDGKAVTNAEYDVRIHTEHLLYSLAPPTAAEADGRFEIKALPTGVNYEIMVMGEGYGIARQDLGMIDPGGEGPKVELPPFQIPVANLRLAGVVVDEEDKPVAGVRIYARGGGQSIVNGLTDSRGRFAFDKLCAGSIELSASSPAGQGKVVVEGGDTNITIRIAAEGGGRAAPPSPVSLEGKPLPDLTPLGLTAADTPANRRLLAVFIDADRRPSRRVLDHLTELAGALKAKGGGGRRAASRRNGGRGLCRLEKGGSPALPCGAFEGES